MKPLRKTLELLLSQEAPQPGAVLPARSSHVSPGVTLGGTLALESASQGRFSAIRRAKSSSVLQAFPVVGRPRVSEGLEPGLARSIRRAPGETDQLLCRVPSSDFLRSVRTSRVGAPGPPAHSCSSQAGYVHPRCSGTGLAMDMDEDLCTMISIRPPHLWAFWVRLARHYYVQLCWLTCL